MSQTSRDRVNSRRVRTHEKNSGDAVRRLGTIIQSIFCAQSGTSIRLTVWKWSGDSRYPGAFVAPFLPARLTGPGSPRMTKHETFNKWLASVVYANVQDIFSLFQGIFFVQKQYIWL